MAEALKWGFWPTSCLFGGRHPGVVVFWLMCSTAEPNPGEVTGALCCSRGLWVRMSRVLGTIAEASSSLVMEQSCLLSINITWNLCVCGCAAARDAEEAKTSPLLLWDSFKNSCKEFLCWKTSPHHIRRGSEAAAGASSPQS